MEKSSGKVKICIFISGRGSNLKSIIKESQKPGFPAKITLVISDRANAKGLIYAKQYKIPSKIVNFKKKNRFEKRALFEIKSKKVKLLCLAGFLKILSPKFIKNFKHKIINIHPSLLPKYKGLNPHTRVIKNKENYSGCTVHYVTSKLDSGKIILQKKVKIKKNETVQSLKRKILKQEHIIYPKAIKLVCT